MTYCNPTELAMAIGRYTVWVRNFKFLVVIFYWTNKSYKRWKYIHIISMLATWTWYNKILNSVDYSCHNGIMEELIWCYRSIATCTVLHSLFYHLRISNSCSSST